MTIDRNALDNLAQTLRYYSVAETAWQRRVALDLYRATATPALVADLVAEYTARAPTTADLDEIAGHLRHLAGRLDAYGTNLPPAAGYIAVISITGDTNNRRNSDMAYVLQVGQEFDASVTYQDAHGNTAQVETETWTSSDDTVLGVTDNGDGSATATAGATGTAQVQLVADARFGEDVVELRAVLDVEVVAAEAVTAVITPGEARDTDAAPTPDTDTDDGEPEA